MKHKKQGSAAVLTPVAAGGGSVSTMQAARMCGVSTFSVQRWFDQGMLQGTTLPGGRRRISTASLERFMKKHIVPGSGREDAALTKVLIVDDDAKLLNVMKDTLEAGGKNTIRTASSGLEAGLAVAEYQPDVLVIDVMLEDVPGPLIIRRIRESAAGRNMRIVAISGKATDAEVRDVKAAGADTFLKKPFRMADLVAASVTRTAGSRK